MKIYKRMVLLVVLLPILVQAAPKPNVVLILLDDFGVGQFAPLAKQLSVEDISYGHLQYVSSLGDMQYDAKTALDFAQRAMPTMDRLSEEGALFCNAFASSNLCAPSRQGILTGRQQIRWGAYRNKDVNICGLPEHSVLAEVFQKAGYATGFIGKWHVGGTDASLREAVLKQVERQPGETVTDLAKRPEVNRTIIETGFNGSVVAGSHPLNNGFDYYFGYNRWECPFYDSELIWENFRYTGLQKQYNTEQFTDKAIDFMKGALSEDRPFFVEISYHAMHDPLDPLAPERYRKPFQSGNEYLDKYFSHLYAVDQNIQKLLDFLKQKKQLDQTVVMFTADNGATCTARSVLPGNAPHSGYKGSLRQGGFKVPLVIWYPRGFSHRGLAKVPVSTMDIMPTALALAGLDTPGNLDGKSLVPTLKQKTDQPVHDHFVWAGIHSRAWGYDRDLNPGLPESWRNRSPGGWVVVQDPYLLRYVGSIPQDLHPDLPLGCPAAYELYHIRKDPLELHNLVLARPDKARELTELYWKLAADFPEPHFDGWPRDRWQVFLEPFEARAEGTLPRPCSHLVGAGGVIAPGAELQEISTEFSFTEGPATDTQGNVYFTDQPNDRIMIYTTDGELKTFMQPAGRANGMYFDHNGFLLACADNNSELWKIDVKTKEHKVLVRDYQGMRLNSTNDLWVRPDGGIYVSDPFYKRPWWTHDKPTQDGQHVYYLRPETGVLTRVVDTMKQPNGLIGTPDGKTLYISDIKAGKIYRYAVQRDGSLTNQTLFCDMGSDGMTLDCCGNVYLTNGKGVVVFDPNGQQIECITIPQGWTANVTFGGRDRDMLFITAKTGIYTLKMNVCGAR